MSNCYAERVVRSLDQAGLRLYWPESTNAGTDDEWYANNRRKYIAILMDDVLGVDSDLTSLCKEIYDEGVDRPVWIRQIDRNLQTAYLRSPRPLCAISIFDDVLRKITFSRNLRPQWLHILILFVA